MSYVFGDETEQRQQFESLISGWDGQNEAEPSAFEGVGSAVGDGLMRGGVKTARAVGMAGAAAPIALDYLVGNDNLTGESLTDRYFGAVDDLTKDAIDYWTPAAQEVGKVGQVLGGVAEIALPLMAGGGNPTLLTGTATFNPAAELVDKGVDASTAIKAGMAEGVATGLGAWLPFFGGTLGAKIAIGAGANASLGAGARGVESSILSAGGYEDLAKQYDAFDGQALAVDALMGGAFGAIYRGQSPDIRSNVFGEKGGLVRDAVDSMTAFDDINIALKPSDIDAIFGAANVKHWQVDSAPGRPADGESWRQHGQAQELAMRQLLSGERVDVSGVIDGAGFAMKPRDDLSDVVKSLLAEQDSASFIAEANSLIGKESIKENAKSLTAADVAALEKELVPIAEGRLKREEVQALQQELRQLEARRAQVEAQPETDYKEAAKKEMQGTRLPARTAVKLAQEIRARDLEPITDAIASVKQRLDAHGVAAKANSMLSRLETYKRNGAFLSDEVARTFSPEPALPLDGGQAIESPAGPAGAIDAAASGDGTAFYKRDAFTAENQTALPQSADDVAIDALRQLLDEHGDFDVRLAVESTDGEAGITRSVRELIDEADAELANSKSMGEGILAAARCFLALGA